MPLTDEKMIRCFRVAYKALSLLGEINPEAATPATASLRLIMSMFFGEERQRELVGQWNDEPALARHEGMPDVALHRLAEEGIAFAFVCAGMPAEWAKRHSHLFQYMPPVHAPLEHDDLMMSRDAARNAGEFAHARDAGNMLLALAVLDGDGNRIRELAAENLAILDAWRLTDPNLGREYEFEKHTWLRDHAVEMAQWGEDVSRHIEMMAQ